MEVKNVNDSEPLRFTIKDTDFLLKLIMESNFKGTELDLAHSVLTKLAIHHRELINE